MFRLRFTHLFFSLFLWGWSGAMVWAHVTEELNLRQQSYGQWSTQFPSQNIVFYAPAMSDDAPPLAIDELWFAVEIPAGTNKKYEFRSASGSLFLDRVLCPRKVAGQNRWVQNFPAHYGISPGLFNRDGDPVDLLVLGADEIYSQMIRDLKIQPRRVKILGTLQMEECSNVPCQGDLGWEQDYKILAVDESVIHGKEPLKTKPLAPISDQIKEALVTFFSNYKGPVLIDNKEYPQTRVRGILDQDQTLKFLKKNFKKLSAKTRNVEVVDCQKVFTQRLARKFTRRKFDPKFLTCIHRVHDARFLPDSAHFESFLKYALYQRLLELKFPGADPALAVEQMESLRKNNRSYYRYITFDQPTPGTGQPIFELVKSKFHNQGCQPGFSPQHYESQPLIMPAQMMK